ncbi:MAG: YigZ family protein [Synergistaceae bacterium]|nr:YigZ family protein [Synergistaceae bacterium]
MSSDTYIEPSESASYETNIKRSRFIANVIPCRDEDAAKERLKELCALHRQADHNCWAYVLGTEPLTEHSSDAGEPSGTAGRPILGEIARSGLVNLLVVVTRYFGGVKLGTRGLIEAYSGTAAQALARAPRALRIRTRSVKVYFPYNSIGDVAHLFTKSGNEGDLQWDYSSEQDENKVNEVSVIANFRISVFPGLLPKLNEMKDRKIILGYEVEREKQGLGIRKD